MLRSNRGVCFNWNALIAAAETTNKLSLRMKDGIIGASLSEPHTSSTALRTRVCHIYIYMLAWTDHLPEILNERIQIFHEDRYRDIVKHVKASGGLLSEAASWTRSEDD